MTVAINAEQLRLLEEAAVQSREATKLLSQAAEALSIETPSTEVLKAMIALTLNSVVKTNQGLTKVLEAVACAEHADGIREALNGEAA